MDHAIQTVISALLLLAGLVLAAVGFADSFLAALMTKAGIDAHAQTLILLVAALVLIVIAVRRLGIVFAVLATILLVLLLLRWALPDLHVPPPPLPLQSVI